MQQTQNIELFGEDYKNLVLISDNGNKDPQIVRTLANGYGISTDMVEDKICAIDSTFERLLSAEDNSHSGTESDRKVNNMSEENVKTESEGILDFAKEQEKVDSIGGDYFKPVEGKNMIKFLDNGSAIKSQKYDDRTVEQRDFKVEVEVLEGNASSMKELTWSVTVGGKASLYGQIIAFGVKKNGLKGNTMRLQRVGTKKDDTKYMVIDD